MKKCLFLCLCLFLYIALYAQASFTVSPPKYEILTGNNEEKTFIVYVENTGDDPIHIKSYPSDWDLDIENNPVFFPPSTINESCSDWFYINPLEFNINPGTGQEVRITMTVPEDAFGEYRSMIFFESTPFNPEFGSMLQFAGRVGCTVYCGIIGTISRNGEITDMDYSRDTVAVSFSNTGNMHERADVMLSIKKDGRDVYTYALSEQLVLPGRDREFLLPVETPLSSGTYTLHVSIDYGGNEILVGEKTVYVKQ